MALKNFVDEYETENVVGHLKKNLTYVWLRVKSK